MNKIKLLYIILLLSIVTSCRKGYLDINTDPDAATKTEPEYLLNFSAAAFANERMAEIYGTRLYTQTWLGGEYNAWDDEFFTVSPFTTNNFWSITYGDVISNANQAREQALIKFSEPDNAVAQVDVWKAYVFYSVSMLWEDVPFTEVGQINTIVAPKYDDQQVVLNGVLSLLDDAIDKFNTGNNQKINDPWFSGDISKWKKLARSLKLKVLMTMVDADPTKASEIGDLISDGGFMTSNSDNWSFNFINESGKKNPIWMIVEKYYGSDQECWLASNVVLDLLQSNNDPRIEQFYELGPDATDYLGIDPYESNTAYISECSRVSTNIVNGAYPDYMMTYAEQELLIAEAITRGFASGDAASNFASGVSASMDHYGVSGVDASTYITNLDFASASTSDALVLIYHEQYLDLFDRALEPWTQWRRTEYPALTLPEYAEISDIIRRLSYSPTEQAANANAKANKPLDTKMWFDL
ncbi:MAG: SusD/RagB family nutrient-binding outer membrane lipoprotein [Sphingobacteriales bacterium]|jgi:hypothetical protein|nr:MAG: SusD/RagB family nutrient-binding outer membrane lipoprotein [Sphingobacteriales bacterium]